jgi:hypothetical protein
MLRLLRVVLLIAIAVLLLETAIAFASHDTGIYEKAVVMVIALLLVIGASRVWRIGAPKSR